VEPLYRLVEVLLRPPVRRGLRWRVEGVDRIPADGPVLLASNHISYFDPIAIANLTDLARRRVRFLAKAELFRNRALGAALRSMGQIPVERGTGDATALDAAAAALADGQCVHVFPEGTISDDLDPMAGKTGLARLARAAEKHYGCPQDVEWAVDGELPAGENVVLLQARPETVWSKKKITVSTGLDPMASIVATLAKPLHARKS